jgi:perosamine synthetase
VYLKECLDTNFVSSVGPFVDRFERKVAEYLGVQHAVATVNGTAALHVALVTGGVQPNDEVLVSALTFIAPANAIRYAGAWPIFIDAEPDYWQMDSQRVIDFLERGCCWKNGELRNLVTQRRVRAILPVHILGHPVCMDPIAEVAQKFNLRVIEDATESLGAKYRQRMVGRLGDIACLSFNGNKLITAGGGGMLLTDNAEWARRARYLSRQAKDDPLEFIHNEVGFNYRLTNIQAALGLAQLEHLDEFIMVKRHIANTYSEGLGSIAGITPMQEASWAASVFWMYTVLVNDSEYGMSSRELLRELATIGIQTRPLWQPINLSPAHRTAIMTRCPVAEQLNIMALSLPCSVGLTHEQQERVLAAVRQRSGYGRAATLQESPLHRQRQE